MSENNEKTMCPESGTEAAVNESGTLEKICDMLTNLCEDDTPDDDNIELCEQAGEDVVDDLQKISVSSDVKHTFGYKVRNILSNNLINRLCVFLLSLAILLLSLAPIANYKLSANEESYKIGFSGFDLSQVVLYSVVGGGSYQEPDAVASAEEAPLSEKDVLEANSLITAKRHMLGLKPTVLIACALFITYFILCAVFFILAAKNLIVELFSKKENRKRLKKYASDTMPAVLLCFMPVIFLFVLEACRLCTNNVLLGGISLGASLSGGAVASIVLAFLGTLLVCMARCAAIAKIGKRYINRSRIKHIVCAFLIIVLLLSSLLPFLDMKSKDQNMSISMSDIREMTFGEYEGYYLAHYNQPDESISIENGIVDDELVNTVLFGTGNYIVYLLYIVIQMTYALILLLGGLLLLGIIRRGFLGKAKVRSINILRVFTLVVVSLAFVFSLIFKSMIEHNLYITTWRYLSIDVGSGVILMFVCSVLALCVRFSPRKTVEYVDSDYDNADTSYAPYVVNDK